MALEEIHGNTYLLKHGEDGSLKCLYGFILDREPIQIQQKYCMQPVHVILLQPSSFWQGKETAITKLYHVSVQACLYTATVLKTTSTSEYILPPLYHNTRIFSLFKRTRN